MRRSKPSRSSARQSVNIPSGRDQTEKGRGKRFENKILKNPQNEGSNPTSESKKPVAMVLVRFIAQSVWREKPGLDFPIASAQFFKGLPPSSPLMYTITLIFSKFRYTYEKGKKTVRKIL